MFFEIAYSNACDARSASIAAETSNSRFTKFSFSDRPPTLKGGKHSSGVRTRYPHHTIYYSFSKYLSIQ